MSNAIFPIFPGLTWNITKRPKWATIIKRSVSGREFRKASYASPVWEYKLSYEFLRGSNGVPEMQQMAAFFNNRQGSFDSWLFDDVDDNSVTAQDFGIGDGTTKTFQLVRSFGGNSEAVYDLKAQPDIMFNGQNANLVTNNSFENRANDLRPKQFYQYNNSEISTTYLSIPGRINGTAYGLRANAASSSTFGILSYDSVVDDGIAGGICNGGWEPNKTYTLSFYAKKVNGASWSPGGGGTFLAWNTAPATIIIVANPSLSTNWQRYVYTFTWGSQVESGKGFFISANGNTVAGDEIHIDDIQVVRGATAPGYMVGEQGYSINAKGAVTFIYPPANGSIFSWTGQYYWRCRFLVDHLDFNQFLRQLWELKTLEFTTVKP